MVSANEAGQRLDKLLATWLPDYSRARLQSWIADGHVQVNGQVLAGKTKLPVDAQVDVQMPQEQVETQLLPQDIPLNVVYEDEALLVINKPAGLTVHPGAGQPDGTLQNGLLHYRPSLAQVPRAGIVHRLDKDTSGLLVIAATLESQTALVRDLQAREISREYLAWVWGVPIAGTTIDEPLRRHPRDRKRFQVGPGGRDAVTHFRVEEKYEKHARLLLKLETGRTHQIRVHLHHIGYPIVGDPVYGRRGDPYRQVLPRQALHAWRLGLVHPVSGEEMSWTCEPPEDLQAIEGSLRDL